MSYQERALAIIDRLTDSKAINIRERGTLRRAILEKPFEINVFLENADESTLLDIKKQLSQILTDRAEREAYAEARREAMRLDEADGTLKGRGFA